MHDTAYEIARIFFRSFLNGKSRVLELGSLDVNGSLRELASPETAYVGVDIVPGKSVDLVLDDPHKLPFPDESFDAVVSSSCFEHDTFFWISFLEMCRVSKEGGFIYVSSPSNGAYHTHPLDCWRFYPDSAKALFQWARHNNVAVTLIESFIANRKKEPWNDCVMIFKKGEVLEYSGPFISDVYSDIYNLTKYPSHTTENGRAYTEDMAIIDKQRSRIQRAIKEESIANKKIDSLILAQSDFRASLQDLSSSLAEHHTVLESMAVFNVQTRSTLDQIPVTHSETEAKLKIIGDRLEHLQSFVNAQMRRPPLFKECLFRLAPGFLRGSLKRDILSRDIRDLKQSTLFDPAWYLAKYPDVQLAGSDPATHYVLHGEEEGRQPGVEFNHPLKEILRYRRWASAGSYHVQYLRSLKIGDQITLKPHKSSENHTSASDAIEMDVGRSFRGRLPNSNRKASNFNILFIGHEATLTGAPIGLLELIRELTENYPINSWLVLQSGGPLLDKFRAITSVLLMPELTEQTGDFNKSVELICQYFEKLSGPKAVLANTAATETLFCQLFKNADIPYFTWIQEMADAIEQHFGGKRTMSYLSEQCESLLFLSQLCFEDNITKFNLETRNTKIIESGVRLIKDRLSDQENRSQVRRELGIPEKAILILGCGTIESRKGTDLFVQTATQYYSNPSPELDPLYFIWVGKSHFPEFTNSLLNDIKKAGLEDRILFVGEKNDPHSYFKASDIFLFTSRSETLGLVAVEAIGYKLPVIGFRNASGAEPYIEKGFGLLVPYLDTAAMVESLRQYLRGQVTIRDDGDKFVQEHLSPEVMAKRFFREFEKKLAPHNVKRDKTILVASTGCPPLCGSRAEGGGLRAWALAKHLKVLLPDFSVTMCYSERLEGNIKDGHYEGVFVTRWEPADLKELVAKASTVILSYCSGDFSKRVTALLEPWQQLILDCYVPIYVELCARRSKHVQREFDAIQNEISTFNENLKRGDFFLCANPAQVTYYQGVLSALGRVNPKTFDDIGLRVVPYGIESTEPVAKARPIKELLGGDYETSRKILWFGAVYPWFNIRMLLNAIHLLNQSNPTRLIVVGARNPFNQHPDFVEAAVNAQALFFSSPYNDFVQTHEWIPYEDRADWYLDCDLIITLNEPGIENGLSWRTRVADYVWAGMPLATNGGDPLGEELISYGAAGRLDVTSTESLARTISQLWDDDAALKEMKERMRGYRPKLYWENVVLPLADVIQKRMTAADR